MSVTDSNKKVIENFVSTQRLSVSASSAYSDDRLSIPDLVSIGQHAESMFFQFSMTCEQARELAAALVHFADQLQSFKVTA